MLYINLNSENILFSFSVQSYLRYQVTDFIFFVSKKSCLKLLTIQRSSTPPTIFNQAISSKIVAKKASLKFIDTDSNIEKVCAMKISEIFKKKGEKYFRIEESREILKSLKERNSVIALGGGAFINKAIRDYVLKSAVSIWLDASLKDLNKRII